MRTRIIKIGNSKGIIIPKSILKKCGITGEVEMEIRENKIIIKPFHNAREGWEEAFKLMAEKGDDKLLDNEYLKN